MGKRRRTAIVETKKGILLTSMRKGPYRLPGGGADRGETRFMAAIRELKEETGLMANYAKLLFRYKGRQAHTVVLIKAGGSPKPKREVKSLKYYRKNKDIKLSRDTKAILKKYFRR